MLSRIVLIPLRYQFSAASKGQFSSIPQVTKQNQKELQQVNKLSQEITSVNYGDNSLNFQQQVEGKRLILQSLPKIESSFHLSEVSTALFSIGAAYGLLANFNYVLTLAFGVGAIASAFAKGGINSARKDNMITAIHIDKDQRLHINYLKTSGFDSLITDKKNFTFNALNNQQLTTDKIWCKVNNEEFWISKSNLQINNQQRHHLL